MIQEELKKQLQEFTNIRDQQKSRGLNDYNVMTAIRKAHSEVGMHSNFIYSLLEIEGNHYQGDLFAKLFIEHTLLYALKDFGKIQEIQMEEDADGRRIDFTIKSDNYYIGIEMKIYAEDQPNQIADYFKDLTQKAQKDKNQTVEIYYLTLDGKEASNNSCQDTRYKIISFEKHILNWLEASKKEVSNITNLNNAIGYYTDVVKQLTNKYQSPINRYEDFFLNQEIYECYEKNQNTILKDLKDSVEIKKAFKNTKQKLYDDFYKNLLKPILENNISLLYFRYINNTTIQEIQIVLNQFYSVNLSLNKTHTKFESIKVGIAWAFNNEGKNNKELKQRLGDYNTKLGLNNTLDYIRDNKGYQIESEHILPILSIENLFLAQKKQIEPLSKNIADEIQNHINIIMNNLK